MAPLSLRRPFGFARRMRVVKQRDFDRAFAHGARARGATLAVVVQPNGLDHPRLGLSVGRRIWKSAVKRNRVRRIFREAFRLSRAELPAGVDVILMAARPELEPRLEETRAELVRLVAKAHGKLRARAAEKAGGPEPTDGARGSATEAP